MGDQKKEGAGVGALLAEGGSTDTGRKSRVDPRQGRGEGDQPCNKFPGTDSSGAVGRRLRSSPLASGAWGRSQGRQHCGAIREMGSALTAAGDSGPGAVPRAGQTLAAPGPAPRGGRRRGRLGDGRGRRVGEGPSAGLALGPASLARGPCHLGFSPHELQPERCLLSAGRKSGALARSGELLRAEL